MHLVTEVLDLLNTKPLGEGGVGLYGISQYNYTYDCPANKEFVKLFREEYNDIPDTWEGETWQGLHFMAEGIRKAKSTDATAVRTALEGLELDTLKGKVTMRACDHQAEQQVLMAHLEMQEGVSYPTPKIIKSFPPDQVTPGCRKDTF